MKRGGGGGTDGNGDGGWGGTDGNIDGGSDGGGVDDGGHCDI